MKKPRLDTKSEKSAGALFDDENLGENEVLSFENSAKLSKLEADRNFSDKSFVSVLKGLFLFLPGAFFLFFMSFAAAVISMEIVVFRRPTEMLPDDYPLQLAFISFIIFLGTLMTWFGLGDIKNKRHFAIPASIAITGAITGAIVKAAASVSDLADRMLDDFAAVIYLFPLALIVPVLAKGVVDRKTENV